MVHGITRVINGNVVIMLSLILWHVTGIDASIPQNTGNIGVLHLISTFGYGDDIFDGEPTRAEIRAQKKLRKKQRKEAERNRREFEKKKKEREELIRRALEMRRKMLEVEVTSDRVWKNCNVVVLSADEGLDSEYIERMLRTYLSSIARLIAERENYGECIIDITVDNEGKHVGSSLLQNSFTSNDLVAELEQFFSTRNYGKSAKKKEGSLQVLVTREFTRKNSLKQK